MLIFEKLHMYICYMYTFRAHWTVSGESKDESEPHFSTDSWNFEILVCNRFQIFMNHNKNNILFYLLHIISVKLSFLEIFWCFQDIDFGFGLKRNFWYIACNFKELNIFESQYMKISDILLHFNCITLNLDLIWALM